jgi:hypothetical protein
MQAPCFINPRWGETGDKHRDYRLIMNSLEDSIPELIFHFFVDNLPDRG